MTDEKLGLDLARWMEDTEFAPPDASSSAHLVATRLPQTRQLGRRWWLPPHKQTQTHPPTIDQTTDYQPTPIPATNGQTPVVTGRTQIMFSPAKAITAGALVFAIGGVMLIAQPFDQQGGPVPGAATDGYIAPVEVTGTSRSPVGCGETDYEGEFEGIGADAFIWACSTENGMPWSMSDPRLEGTVERINEESRITLEDGTWLYIAQSAFSIENDGGAWRERPRQWLLPEGYGPTYDWLTDEVIVLDGDGEYEGLVAVLRATGPLSDFHGYIIDERLFPPAPDNASTQ